MAISGTNGIGIPAAGVTAITFTGNATLQVYTIPNGLNQTGSSLFFNTHDPRSLREPPARSTTCYIRRLQRDGHGHYQLHVRQRAIAGGGDIAFTAAASASTSNYPRCSATP